jgi:tetratricopeptide (TPR) repeat protein
MKNTYDLIDAYLKGELTSSQRFEFDSKLKSDPEFQEEFQEIKNIHNSIKESARENILSILKNQETSIQSRKTIKTNTTMKKYISIAASLLLVVAFGYLTFFNTTTEINNEKVFAEYYRTYNNLESGSERGAAIDLSSLKNQAYYAYDMENFFEAEDALSELVKVEQSAANFFYLGVSNIETGNNDEAVKNLNTVINNYSQYDEQAQWYLALTLLKEGANNEALANLIDLSIRETSKKEESLKILKEQFGLTNFNTDPLVIKNSEILPPEEEDDNQPDGSTIGRRRFQQGTLVSPQDGSEYTFFNDRPIESLREGDYVEAIIISRGHRGKKGFAFIIG